MIRPSLEIEVDPDDVDLSWRQYIRIRIQREATVIVKKILHSSAKVTGENFYVQLLVKEIAQMFLLLDSNRRKHYFDMSNSRGNLILKCNI